MDNIILVAGILGLFLGGFGYFRPKLANGLFLLSIIGICVGSVMQLKATGEIHELSTGAGETVFVELSRKLGWIFEIFERLSANVQTAIFVFIGVFFVARIVALVALANSPERKEKEKKRRKRILKSFNMKNMEDLRSRY